MKANFMQINCSFRLLWGPAKQLGPGADNVSLGWRAQTRSAEQAQTHMLIVAVSAAFLSLYAH